MKRRLSIFLVSLAYCIVCGAFWATAAEQARKPVETPAAAPVEEKKEPPPPVKRVEVTVDEGRLSVDLENAPFGEVIESISKTMPIRKVIASDTYQKTITTRFDNLEMDDGILRLLSLIKEKNYLLQYDSNGNVNFLEVYGSPSTGMSVSKTSAPQRPRPQQSPQQPSAPPVVQQAPVTPPVPQVVRPAPRVIKNPPAPTRILRFGRRKPAAQEQDTQQPQQPEDHEVVPIPEETPLPEAESPVEAVPYVPPARQPAPVLPKSQ